MPHVRRTSNGTRDLLDAQRRRCLCRWLDHPTLARETGIVRMALPDAELALVPRAVGFLQRLRGEDLGKGPSVCAREGLSLP